MTDPTGHPALGRRRPGAASRPSSGAGGGAAARGSSWATGCRAAPAQLEAARLGRPTGTARTSGIARRPRTTGGSTPIAGTSLCARAASGAAVIAGPGRRICACGGTGSARAAGSAALSSKMRRAMRTSKAGRLSSRVRWRSDQGGARSDITCSCVTHPLPSARSAIHSPVRCSRSLNLARRSTGSCPSAPSTSTTPTTPAWPPSLRASPPSLLGGFKRRRLDGCASSADDDMMTTSSSTASSARRPAPCAA